jgi:hypothetical protein
MLYLVAATVAGVKQTSRPVLIKIQRYVANFGAARLRFVEGVSLVRHYGSLSRARLWVDDWRE